MARGGLHSCGSVAAEPRTTPCAGGEKAHYRELRSKPIVTALGKVEVSRPYYVCPTCHTGQFPADRELDIEHTEFSPGVRGMQAVVWQDAPVSPPTPVCGLGRHRSRIQNRDRFPLQTFGNVLDRPRSQRHPRPALLISQRPLRGLLGEPTGRLTSPSMSRTRNVFGA